MINKLKVCCIQKVIPLAFDESLSYLETLLGVLNKLNETIDRVNSMSDVVDNINVNFDEVNRKITELNVKIEEVSYNMSILQRDIMQEVESEMTQLYNRIVSLMNDYQSVFNANIDALRNDLQEQINEIELGSVMAYNPTTGEYENVSKVIQDVYDALRNNSITCSEFDALELTATEYDALDISAYNFDVNGRTFLLGD